MDEKISIVVPVYNTGAYLDCFFTHLESQTFKDFKAYIVYDVSNDNSLEIIEKYRQKDPEHFIIIYSPYKDGLGAARDYALNSGKLKGEYVLFLDPDDYPDENFLDKLYSKAIETNADITICGFDRFNDADGRILCVEMTHNPEKIVTDIKSFDLLAYMNPVVWDKLYKRSLIQEVRFTNIKRTEDVFWLMRLVPKIKSIAFINQVLYHYRVREDSLLNSFSEKGYEEVKKGLIKISIEMEKNGVKNSDRWDLIEFIAFCRFGIGVTYRVSNKSNQRKIEKETCDVLDKYYSGWRKNPFLRFRNCIRHGFKGFAIWCCAILYKTKSFGLYIAIYTFFKKIFRKEIRW